MLNPYNCRGTTRPSVTTVPSPLPNCNSEELRIPRGLTPETDLRFSERRFSVEYHIRGSAAVARERANLLCIEQTVEAAVHVIPSGAIRDQLLGQVTASEPLSSTLHRTAISFPIELLDGSVSTLLHRAFGMFGLRGQVRLTNLSGADEMVAEMVGPDLDRRTLATYFSSHSSHSSVQS